MLCLYNLIDIIKLAHTSAVNYALIQYEVSFHTHNLASCVCVFVNLEKNKRIFIKTELMNNKMNVYGLQTFHIVQLIFILTLTRPESVSLLSVT